MGRSAADILKEYLIAIGFEVDEEKAKKAGEKLEKLNRRIEEIGTVAAGAAVALSASVVRMSNDLERFYFASQRTGASVANIKELSISAQQIGISAEEASGMLEAFARNLRMNPGLTGYLRTMGVDVTKNKMEMLMDLVGKLRNTPFPIAARIAQRFGISDDELQMMLLHYNEMRKAQEEQRRLSKDVHYEEMADRAHKFMVELRELGVKMEGLGYILSDRFLPLGHELVRTLGEVVDILIKADKATDGWSSRILGVGTAVAGVVGSLGVLRGALGLLGIGGAGASAAAGAGGAGLLLKGGSVAIPGILGGLLAKYGIEIKTDEYNTRADADYMSAVAGTKQAQAFVQQYMAATGRNPYAEAAAGNKNAWIDYANWIKSTGRMQNKGGGSAGAGGNFKLPGENYSEGFLSRHPAFRNGAAPVKDPRALVQKYAEAMGVDVSLAEAQAWWESRFNPNARSKKGALGIMQLMPETAKGLGVDPNNMDDNIRGGITLMHNLLQKYSGNVALALAAYNAGEGAVGRYGGIPPFAETQQYVQGIMGNMDRYRLGQDFSTRPSVVLTQKTDINVHGSDSPEQVGQAVGREQERINGDMLRNLQGAMQ